MEQFKVKKIIAIIASSIITIATLIGFVFAFDNHYAKAEEITVVIEAVQEDIMTLSNRIDSMKLEDELLLVKKKIERLEDRWGQVFYERFNRYWQTKEELKGVMPDDYKKDYDELLEDKERLEEAIKEKNKKKVEDN